ncbi:hypothetical protein [Paraburkholderia lacunae]|uniref:Secreted protein n=1 Tax=Paraburkholderia lacunae TaxID=2211104 RepID=A0A370N7U2_9BURK|nr:hypothetical protein [Paraburkholderia lacunae]RDK01687.1 hypothetical protein DLM46_15045 [Paraburkholderia lacunae]
MNTRNIQTFLMVSAAFFAMSAPVRSGSAGTLSSNAVIRTAQVAQACIAVERLTQSRRDDEEEQNS